MEPNKETIHEIKWEISENDIKRRMDQKFLFIMTIMTIGLSLVFLLIFSRYLAFLVLVSLIIIASFGHYINSKMKFGSGIPLESYRIDEKGIEVMRLREDKRELFLWSEVSGYHVVDKNLMAIMGHLFGKLERSIIIFINDHRKFSLDVARRSDYEKVIAELSKRVKQR